MFKNWLERVFYILESIPKWARRKNGAAIDEAVAEVAAAGFPVQDANSLFDILQVV